MRRRIYHQKEMNHHCKSHYNGIGIAHAQSVANTVSISTVLTYCCRKGSDEAFCSGICLPKTASPACGFHSANYCKLSLGEKACDWDVKCRCWRRTVGYNFLSIKKLKGFMRLSSFTEKSWFSPFCARRREKGVSIRPGASSKLLVFVEWKATS